MPLEKGFLRECLILFATWIYDNVKDSLDKVLFSSYLKKTLIIREQKNHHKAIKE